MSKCNIGKENSTSIQNYPNNAKRINQDIFCYFLSNHNRYYDFWTKVSNSGYCALWELWKSCIFLAKWLWVMMVFAPVKFSCLSVISFCRADGRYKNLRGGGTCPEIYLCIKVLNDFCYFSNTRLNRICTEAYLKPYILKKLSLNKVKKLQFFGDKFSIMFWIYFWAYLVYEISKIIQNFD